MQISYSVGTSVTAQAKALAHARNEAGKAAGLKGHFPNTAHDMLEDYGRMGLFDQLRNLQSFIFVQTT